MYLGDGDSKAFKSVVDSKPYDNCDINKLECVGHIQKRVGGRLRRLLKEKKGNNLVWLRCPKTTFCGLNVVSIAVYDAVLCFNAGNSGRIKVLVRAGLEPGVHTLKILHAMDKKRITKAELSILELEKQARQKKRSRKRNTEDEDDTEYQYGGH